ncbi:MAG: 1-phosphofructokinase family hexose kinase [Anaerolineae bacterium]
MAAGEDIVALCPNPALDKSAHIDHVVPDEKLRCDRPRVDPGGGGVNVARAIHRIDGDCRVLYLAGGPIGDLVEDLLQEEGVSQRRESIAGNTRESITVFEDATGKEYRFSMPGAEVSEEEWHRYLDVVFDYDERPDYMVASGSISPGMPDDFYARVARRASDLGIRFIIDSSGEEFRQAVDAGVFLVKPNMRELGHLAGEEIESEEHQIEVSERLVAEGKAEVVIVSLGAAGALLVTQDLQEHVRAPTVKIKSKIGAGDTMVGGITLALSRGKSIREAAYFGVAAGSAAVMTPGTELCHKEDVERLYDRLVKEYLDS